MTETVDTTNPMDVVHFTQRTRKKMFDLLTATPSGLTENFKEVSQLLKDMDGTAVMTRKLDIETQAVEDASRIHATHQRLREQLGGRDIYRRDENSPIPIAERVEGVLPGQIPNIPVKFVPGEKAMGEQTLVVSDFVSVDE